MKKLILLILFALPLYGQYQEVPEAFTPPYKGIKNDVEADMVPQGYAPKILNAHIDETGGVNKRRGVINYDNVQTSSGNVLGYHDHWESDGDRYLLKVKGTTMSYTTGDGNWTVLISTLNANYLPDFTTFGDFTIITNGYNDVYFFKDGVVISSSTFPKFRYIDVYEERLWGSGVADYRSRLYYSNARNEIFNTFFDSTYVGENDGDIITGQIVHNGILYVFKNYSIWATIWKYVYGSTKTSDFFVRMVTSELGALYDTSIKIFNSGIQFLSHKGVVHMKTTSDSDVEYNIVSRNISGELKDLAQLKPSKSYWTKTTSLDFGEGQGVNIDTTTTPGSIVMSSYTVYDSLRRISPYGCLSENIAVQNNERKTTIVLSTFTILRLSTITLAMAESSDRTEDIVVQLEDADNVLIASQSIDGTTLDLSNELPAPPTEGNPCGNIANFGVLADFYDWNLSITAGTTYYLVVKSTVTSPEYYFWSGTGTISGTEAAYRMYGDMSMYYTSGQYQSDEKDAGDFIKSWGTFEAETNKPTGTDIDWFVSVSTYSGGTSTNSLVAVTPEYEINTTSTPYILWFASMSTTDVWATPQIDQVTINWYESDATNPVSAMVYDDGKNSRYMIAVTTEGMTKNGVVWVCNQDFAWTKNVYTNIYPYTMGTFRDYGYLGDNTTGRTYRIDVDDTYSDTDNAYESYVYSPVMHGKNIFNEKDYTCVYAYADDSGEWNLSWGYTLNASSGDIIMNKDIYLYKSDGSNIWDRGNFPPIKGYSIQLGIGNNNANEYYDWKAIYIYHLEPLEELR